MRPRDLLSHIQAREGRLHRALFRRALAVFGISVLATSLGTLGGLHWLLELFSHFILWHGLLSAMALILLLLLGRWRWSIVACGVLAAQVFVPLHWYLPGATTSAAPNLRILVANIHTSNTNTEAFLELVKTTDPDVICVQEINDVWARALKEIETDYPIHSLVSRSDNFGIATFSRLPGGKPDVVFQDTHQVPALSASIEIAGRSTALLNLHTLPPMSHPMAQRRNAQLNSARAWVAGRLEPAIIVGDLNLTMFSPEYRRFTKDLNLRNARQGFGPLGTWPAWMPFARLPLDHCLVRGDVDVVRCVVGPNIGSDHLPLIIDLHVATT